MDENKKRVKFEIDSAPGTPVENTSWANFSKLQEVLYATICGKCGRVIPDYKYFKKFRQSLFMRWHKCGPIKMFKDVQIDIGVKPKTRALDFWKWN